MLFPLLCLGALLSVSYADFNSTEPIIVSISPKIWTLLKSKDKLIKDAIKSVKLKDIDKKKGWLHVRAWDGKIDNFSVDPAGISFQDMKNGIHLRVKNVSVHATYKGRVELGRKLLGLPLRIARASGNLRLKSENGSLDIKLAWDDFKFKPTVSMTSDISVEFTKNAKMLKYLKKAIQRRSTKIHAKISDEIAKLIEEKLNPRLQELKRKAATKGISHCDAEFKVQDKILRAVCKPKNTKAKIPSLNKMDKMLCIDATLIKSKKRGSSQKKSAESSTLKENSTKNDEIVIPMPTERKPKQSRHLTVTCLASLTKCEGNNCNYCVDIDVDVSSTGSKENFRNCSPKF